MIEKNKGGHKHNSYETDHLNSFDIPLWANKYQHTPDKVLYGHYSIVLLQTRNYMSADLTKGSFGHFSRFCVIKISKNG